MLFNDEEGKHFIEESCASSQKGAFDIILYLTVAKPVILRAYCRGSSRVLQ